METEEGNEAVGHSAFSVSVCYECVQQDNVKARMRYSLAVANLTGDDGTAVVRGER